MCPEFRVVCLHTVPAMLLYTSYISRILYTTGSALSMIKCVQNLTHPKKGIVEGGYSCVCARVCAFAVHALLHAFYLFANVGGSSLTESLRMCCVYPGEVIRGEDKEGEGGGRHGRKHNMGSLLPGFAANLTLLDREGEARGVVIGGIRT